MTVRDAYNQWAATYDTDNNRTRDLDAEITRHVLADYQPHSLLELGCGTGKNTPFYASISPRIVALDFSDGMIAQAQPHALTDVVQFGVADFTQPWPLRTASIGLIACNLVLEHITALDFIFHEAARVLSPHGYFFVCELHPFRQYQGSRAVFERDGQTSDIPSFVHHVSDYLYAAHAADFTLVHLDEHWHAEDDGKPPRLLSLMFHRQKL